MFTYLLTQESDFFYTQVESKDPKKLRDEKIIHNCASKKLSFWLNTCIFITRSGWLLVCPPESRPWLNMLDLFIKWGNLELSNWDLIEVAWKNSSTQ